MAETARLRLVADSDGLVKAQNDLKGLADQSEKTEGRTGKSLGAMSSSMGRLAIAAGAMAGAVASAFSFRAITAEAEKFETTMFRVEAIIKATGGAAGKTAGDLRETARALARATLESTEGILEAQQRLLTFRSITGETFDRAIEAAADLGAAMGTSLQSTVVQLARALEDPATGMTALTRSGTVFTEAQKETVKAMVAVGDIAAAQDLILSELEAQYKGTARAAAQGLAGAQDGLSQSFQELKLALAESTGALAIMTTAYKATDAVLVTLAENSDILLGVTVAIGGSIGGIATIIGVRYVASLIAARAATIAATISTRGFTAALAANPIGLVAVALSTLVGGYIAFSGASDDATEAERLLNEQLAGNAPKATAAAEGAIALARTRREQAKASLDAALAELAVLKAEKARADATSDTPANEGMKSFFSQEVEDTIALITQLRGTIKELSDAEAALLLTPPPRPLRIDIPPNDGATKGAKKAADAARRAAEALAESSRTDLEVYRAKIAEINELHRRFPEIVTTEVRDRALKQLREDFASTAEEATIMGDTMRGAFVGLTTGALGLSGALRQVIGRLQEMAANSAFDVLIGKKGGGVGGLFGGLGKIGGALGGLFGPGQTTGTGLTISTPNLLPSFAGGGFTGASSRSGGIDGRGGFPAILHPNEVVTDLTRNRGGGGGGGQRSESKVVVELSPDLIARVLDQARQDTVQIVESSFPRFSANQLPRNVGAIASDPRRVG